MSSPIDPLDEPLPIRTPPAPLSMAHAPSPELNEDYLEGAASSGRRVSAKIVWRAFTRHWWQAVLLWVLASGSLMALAYFKVKPSFNAKAQVRIEPGDSPVFGQGGQMSPEVFNEFKETQVVSVTSPIVLSMALAQHPELFNLPRLRTTEDPEAEIRAALQVAIVPKTSFIQIGMSSQNPLEAAAIVNAVVDAYVKNSSASNVEDKELRIKQFKDSRDESTRKVAAARAELQRLNDQIGANSKESVQDKNRLTLDDYRRWSEELQHVEITVIATQAKLQQLVEDKSAPTQGPDEEQVKTAIRDAFYNDQRVNALQMSIERTERQIDHVKRFTKNPLSDPAMITLNKRVGRDRAQLKMLWTQLEAPLRRRIFAESTSQSTIDQSIQDTRVYLAALTSQADTLKERLGRMQVESKAANSDALQLEFARHDLERAQAILHTIEDKLANLEHEAKSPIARVRIEFHAKKSNRPSSEHRMKIMALAPFAMMFLVLGLFAVVELKAGRVADPDDLPSRVRLQVLGVVPPLPTIRPTGLLSGRVEYRAQRQLDEFVQSLDHLRVALCARPDPWGRDRHCVLITSAIGSEGKTTLAAQLAERCVNAGLMTLLIDADLRNPTLSRMLDALESPGLINILRGETEPEDAMIVVGDAGGFHFLPAGTPKIDPSRLLQGEALGKLIAQARESFDMIIVDAPPVLPVPDALTIGKWTDGAVLAVRYDASRFALVERAHRRLTHVGVNVIGAVVNGVRSTESSYGGYYPYGGSSASGTESS